MLPRCGLDRSLLGRALHASRFQRDRCVEKVEPFIPRPSEEQLAARCVAVKSGEHVVMASITVNGEKRTIDGDPGTPLLWYLRDVAGLTGTKYGCGAGVCGACTIHLDGVAVRSCMTTVEMADGKSVTTIEGLSADGEHAVQKAWRQVSVPQCGFCQAGQIMQAASLLAQNSAPSDEDIVESMSGNLCRCGCYQRIHEAVKLAAGGV
jgi:isoquinoline 1-oxidoreductase alpha subunit